MKLRMPAIPLITVDPYFSVWSFGKINESRTTHWTGFANSIRGLLFVDGQSFRFLGSAPEIQETEPHMDLVSVDCDALTTTAVFETAQVRLTAKFTSPMLADDLYYASRPVSYLKLSAESLDGKEHRLAARVSCSEELVLNQKGEGRAWSEPVCLKTATGIRMGKGNQKILWRSGDDVRIDWGYFYLATDAPAEVGNEVFDDMYAVYAQAAFTEECLFTFAYDDIDSLLYFGNPVKAYWKKEGKTIEQAIDEAISEYDVMYSRCCSFSDKLKAEAEAKGGEQYAEMVLLAYRQVMAGHKLAVDENGENIYISKECFSNGCAATVDVTYPSAPMYLYYNTELLKGMLRPVFRYAMSEDWKFDFAPHDVGRYPIIGKQFYNDNTREGQMPVEECGNMIILTAAICEVDGNAEFAERYIDMLDQWKEYLLTYGADPEDQLCTDDFAGRLAHNCNLSLKAIMGIAGYAKILRYLDRTEEANALMQVAREYAVSWCQRAQDDSGSYRLAFDRPGTFSLKYNAVWDLIWHTELFPKEMFRREIQRYKEELLPYGVPLDSREKYTKPEWSVWTASFAEDKEDFLLLVGAIWNAFNTMRTRVPMTDWYYADTSEQVHFWKHQGFQHRTPIGGLFIRLLLE